MLRCIKGISVILPYRKPEGIFLEGILPEHPRAPKSKSQNSVGALSKPSLKELIHYSQVFLLWYWFLQQFLLLNLSSGKPYLSFQPWGQWFPLGFPLLKDPKELLVFQSGQLFYLLLEWSDF